MAERRMFAKTIIDSDAFLDMPTSTQALYFHLSMRADDDGFINNPKKIQRIVGASDDDMKLLIAKNFIIHFDSGIIVIKHWKIHNYIQNDRYKPTVYADEKAMLAIKNNKAYTLNEECIQDVSKVETQVRLGKDSIDKININTCSKNDKEKEIRKAADEFFERVWKLYPRKKGKSSISYSKKKELMKVGYERLVNAIAKYQEEVKDRDAQYVMYGSSFFNTSYKDYLEDEKPITKPIPDNRVKYDPDDEENVSSHPFEDGWRVDDDGYWMQIGAK